MLLKSISLFFIGFIELFLGVVNFKLTQKNRIICSMITTIIHIYMWAYIISTIVEAMFETNESILMLVTIYALGCGLGDYYGLKSEPFLDKYILKLQRKGRKFRRGKWFKRRKK